MEEIGIEISVGREIGRANQYVYSAAENLHFNKLCTYFMGSLNPEAQISVSAEHMVLWKSPRDAIRSLAHESHAWAIERLKVS